MEYMLKQARNCENVPDENNDDTVEEPTNVAMVELHPVQFNDILNKFIAVSADFRLLQRSGVVPFAELQKWSDNLFQLQMSMRRANSAIQAEKNKNLQQLSIRDFFNHD